MSDDNDQTQTDDNDLRALRQQAKEGKTAQAELAQIRKENLFLKAGVDPNTKLGGLLFRTFDGTEAEALKAEAAELGYFRGVTTEETASERKFTEGETEQQKFRQGLSGGIQPAETQTPNPVDAAYSEFHGSVSKGVPRNRAAVDVMAQILGAGLGGDKRVLWDPAAHFAEAERLEGSAR